MKKFHLTLRKSDFLKSIAKIGLFLIVLTMGLMIGCEPDPDPIQPVVKYTVQVTTNEGGVVNPSGTIKVDEGLNLVIIATPDAGYKLESFMVNDIIATEMPIAVVDGNTLILLSVTKDYNVKATFAKTLSWDVMQVVWKLDSTYIHELNGTWSYYKIWGVPGEMQKTLQFLPNGSTVVTINGTEGWSDGLWRIDETKTPPEIHFGMNDAAPEGSVYVLEGDLKNRLVLARYNDPYIEDSTKKMDWKDVYTPLK